MRSRAARDKRHEPALVRLAKVLQDIPVMPYQKSMESSPCVSVVGRRLQTCEPLSFVEILTKAGWGLFEVFQRMMFQRQGQRSEFASSLNLGHCVQAPTTCIAEEELEMLSNCLIRHMQNMQISHE